MNLNCCTNGRECIETDKEELSDDVETRYPGGSWELENNKKKCLTIKILQVLR